VQISHQFNLLNDTITEHVSSYVPEKHQDNSHLIVYGLNLGYKFVLSSGLYFRTGAFLGAGLDFGISNRTIKEFTSDGWKFHSSWSFYAKPDLTIGYVF
jgi:hypothetical protein